MWKAKRRWRRSRSWRKKGDKEKGKMIMMMVMVKEVKDESGNRGEE